MLRHLAIILFFSTAALFARAQTKLGGNPVYINANAYLELGDSIGADKGFLMPRVALKSSVSASPLKTHVAGMAVYNTASSGMPPYDVNPGIYYNDGSRWLQLYAGSGGAFLQVKDSSVLYVTRAQLLTAVNMKLGVSDTALMLMNYFNDVSNGLSRKGKIIVMGGALTQPTAIGTSSANTLAFTGLMRGAAMDSLLAAENATGIIRKVAPYSLKTAKAVYSAFTGQTLFNVLQPITDINKISLFRNGIRLDVVQVGTNTVQLEPGVICDANDEIKIIQFY